QDQSSSASRFTAGASGFLSFSQSFDSVGVVTRAEPLRDDAFQPHLASVPEHEVARLRQMLVQPQARKAAAQQACGRRLPGLKQLAPKVLAIQLEEVEGA